jgi:Sec-independent protein secretion pathway component TatC
MSQILLAVPMYALYEIGILAVRVLIKPSAASADDGAG